MNKTGDDIKNSARNKHVRARLRKREILRETCLSVCLSVACRATQNFRAKSRQLGPLGCNRHQAAPLDLCMLPAGHGGCRLLFLRLLAIISRRLQTIISILIFTEAVTSETPSL